jgi:hypothetical protein
MTSRKMAEIIGPAAAAPSSVTSSGTPMKPVLGHAATSAPNAASIRRSGGRRVIATATATITRAHTTHTPSTPGLSRRSTGVFMPKRKSRHGSAKYRTKALSPGIATSGSLPQRPAR